MTRFPRALTRPFTSLPGLVLAVALAGIGALVLVPAPEVAAATVTPIATTPVAQAASGHERACASCGVVEMIRRDDSAPGLPVYDFTVRMRDGSTRASSETTRGGWREGDGVMVIGGAAARALEQQNIVAL